MWNILFIAMVVWIEGQYWDMYQSITMIGLGNILPVLYLYLFYESTLLQAYIWEVFIWQILQLLKKYTLLMLEYLNKKICGFFALPEITFV